MKIIFGIVFLAFNSRLSIPQVNVAGQKCHLQSPLHFTTLQKPIDTIPVFSPSSMYLTRSLLFSTLLSFFQTSYLIPHASNQYINTLKPINIKLNKIIVLFNLFYLLQQSCGGEAIICWNNRIITLLYF